MLTQSLNILTKRKTTMKHKCDELVLKIRKYIYNYHTNLITDNGVVLNDQASITITNLSKTMTINVTCYDDDDIQNEMIVKINSFQDIEFTLRFWDYGMFLTALRSIPNEYEQIRLDILNKDVATIKTFFTN
jgi:LEA14-like dessication related protein